MKHTLIEPALLAITAGHLLFVGAALLYAGAGVPGFVAVAACAGLSLRAKRNLLAAEQAAAGGP